MVSKIYDLSEIRKKKIELNSKLKSGCLPVVQSIASDPGSVYLDENYAHLVHFVHHHEEEALLPLVNSLFALNKMLIGNRDYYQNQVSILSGNSAQASKDFELVIHFTNLEQAYLETGLIPVLLQISKKMKYHEFWKENFRHFSSLLEFLEQDLKNFDDLTAHFGRGESKHAVGITGKIVSVNEVPIPKKAARLSLSKEFCTLGCSFSSFEGKYFSILESKQENGAFVSKRQTKWAEIKKSTMNIRLGLKEQGLFKLSLLAAENSNSQGKSVVDEIRLLVVDKEDKKEKTEDDPGLKKYGFAFPKSESYYRLDKEGQILAEKIFRESGFYIYFHMGDRGDLSDGRIFHKYLDAKGKNTQAYRVSSSTYDRIMFNLKPELYTLDKKHFDFMRTNCIPEGYMLNLITKKAKNTDFIPNDSNSITVSLLREEATPNLPMKLSELLEIGKNEPAYSLRFAIAKMNLEGDQSNGICGKRGYSGVDLWVFSGKEAVEKSASYLLEHPDKYMDFIKAFMPDVTFPNTNKGFLTGPFYRKNDTVCCSDRTNIGPIWISTSSEPPIKHHNSNMAMSLDVSPEEAKTKGVDLDSEINFTYKITNGNPPFNMTIEYFLNGKQTHNARGYFYNENDEFSHIFVARGEVIVIVLALDENKNKASASVKFYIGKKPKDKEPSKKDEGAKKSEIELISRLSRINGPYSHGVFGCFNLGLTDYPGHFLQKTKGPSKNIERYSQNDRQYSQLFADEEDENGPQFVARVAGEKVAEGFTFRLIFKDNKGDYRTSSHTDYTLLVPESEIQIIKPAILSNLNILIKVFQQVFPEFDRSGGKLRIYDSKQGQEKVESKEKISVVLDVSPEEAKTTGAEAGKEIAFRYSIINGNYVAIDGTTQFSISFQSVLDGNNAWGTSGNFGINRGAVRNSFSVPGNYTLNVKVVDSKRNQAKSSINFRINPQRDLKPAKEKTLPKRRLFTRRGFIKSAVAAGVVAGAATLIKFRKSIFGGASLTILEPKDDPEGKNKFSIGGDINFKLELDNFKLNEEKEYGFWIWIIKDGKKNGFELKSQSSTISRITNQTLYYRHFGFKPGPKKLEVDLVEFNKNDSSQGVISVESKPITIHIEEPKIIIISPKDDPEGKNPIRISKGGYLSIQAKIEYLTNIGGGLGRMFYVFEGFNEQKDKNNEYISSSSIGIDVINNSYIFRMDVYPEGLKEGINELTLVGRIGEGVETIKSKVTIFIQK